jgi:hypothetical protein
LVGIEALRIQLAVAGAKKGRCMHRRVERGLEAVEQPLREGMRV